MAEALRFIGWRRYRDTGRIHRVWQFTEPVPELGAEKDFLLYQHAPPKGKCLVVLQIRDRADQVVSWPDPEAVAPLFADGVPEWAPPTEGEIELIYETRRLTDASGKLWQLLKEIQDGAKAPQTPPGGTRASDPAPTRGQVPNEVRGQLRRVRAGTWANTGEAFTVWELLADAPWIRVRAADGAQHAQAGDHLWEEADDTTPFRLKRAGQEIATPEHWQVAPLLEETPSPTDATDDPALRELRRVIPGGNATKYGGTRVPYDAWVAEEAIPAAGIQAGDLVVFLLAPGPLSDEQRAQIVLPRLPRLERAAFPALQAHVDRLRLVERFTDGLGKRDPRDALAKHLQFARRGSDASSRILVVRPRRSVVAITFEALSDEGAVFELLQRVREG